MHIQECEEGKDFTGISLMINTAFLAFSGASTKEMTNIFSGYIFVSLVTAHL
jgi:hypothetical protein